MEQRIYLTDKVTQIYDDPMGAKKTSISIDKPCKKAYLRDNKDKLPTFMREKLKKKEKNKDKIEDTFSDTLVSV